MKRSFKKPRVKRVRPAAPIPAPKPERPKRSNLRSIYKDIVSADQAQRLESLKRAMNWYDQCITYAGAPIEYKWPLNKQRLLNSAIKSRALGIESTDQGKQETCFIDSIRSFQKLVNGFHPPKIHVYLSKYSQKKTLLLERKRKLKKRYGEFLFMLQQMLRPKNSNDEPITLKVDKLSTEYRIDGKGNVTFNNKLISYLSKVSRKQGMLTAVVEIFPILMEAAGKQDEIDAEGNRTGRVVISNAKCRAAVQPMLKHLNNYFLVSDRARKLVRRPRTKRRVQ